MSILVNKHTRLIVQGITGSEGVFHTERMRAYGTAIVAGVTPGKGGMNMDGIPVFDSVAEAQKRTGANASILFVPPAGAADAIMEAADAGIEVIVCITEGIPVHDMIRATAFVRKCWWGRTVRALFPPARPRLASCRATSTSLGVLESSPAAER